MAPSPGDALSRLVRWLDLVAIVRLAVGAVAAETTEGIATEADVALQGLEDVETFLAGLADELPEEEAS